MAVSEMNYFGGGESAPKESMTLSVSKSFNSPHLYYEKGNQPYLDANYGYYTLPYEGDYMSIGLLNQSQWEFRAKVSGTFAYWIDGVYHDKAQYNANDLIVSRGGYGSDYLPDYGIKVMAY